MAEAVGLVASVVAIVQITDRIVDVCKFYLESVQGTPSDLRVLLIEISALRSVLDNVKFLASCPGEKPQALGSLSGPDGPVDGCHNSICQLEGLLPQELVGKSGTRPRKRPKIKFTLAQLAWPLKERKARKILDEILLYKSTITVALTAENVHDTKIIKRQTSDIAANMTERQRHEILKWLIHTDPSKLHYQAKENFEPETGKWILTLSEWSEWFDLKYRCLWIHGIPGAGKTTLISNLFQQIWKMCEETAVQKYACVHYYCYYGHEQDETLPFLLWLLHKLCQMANVIPPRVRDLYGKACQPSCVEAMDALADALSSFGKVFVVLDAIDESRRRENLLQVLKEFATQPRFQKIQLLASSREYIDIEHVMQEISTPVSMAHPSIENDIRMCVRSILQSNTRFRRWPSDLLSEIEGTVPKAANGMFRWAVCQIDALQRLKGDYDVVRSALANLPKDLYETYDRVTLQVPEEDQIFVQHALHWIAYHPRIHPHSRIPCRILIEAVTKSAATQGVDLSPRFFDEEVIRELCRCLIKIDSDDNFRLYNDVSSKCSTISFAHFTVQEYLNASRTHGASSLYSASCKESVWRCFDTTMLKEVCQLRIGPPGKWSCFGKSGPFENDFDAYSLSAVILMLQRRPFWILERRELLPFVFNMVNPFKENWTTVQTGMKAFEDAMNLVSGKAFPGEERMWHIDWNKNHVNPNSAALVNLLHIVENGLDQAWLVGEFLETKDVKSVLRSRISFTKTLVYENSQAAVFDGPFIEVLINLDVVSAKVVELMLDFDQGVSDASVLLFYYLARWGSIQNQVVERLLDAGADPNTSTYRVTLLQLAVVHRETDIVMMLLEAGADPNNTGNDSSEVIGAEAFASRYDYLCGASPLHIYQHFASTLDRDLELMLEDSHKRIETELLDFGALDFQEDLDHPTEGDG